MTDKIKDRPEDQRAPRKTDSPSMHDVAAMLLDARKALGARRYGVALQAFNGRDAVQDALEEALDGAAYLAQVAWEQDHPRDTAVGCIIEALAHAIWSSQPVTVEFKGRFVPEAVTKYLTEMEIPWTK